MDKTAQFVAKNGPEFEQRILGSEKNNQKFNFLLPADPYNAYYRGKIAAFKEEAAGGDAAAVQAKADEATKAANEATGTVTVAATCAAAPKIIAAPSKGGILRRRAPGHRWPLDLDVIKLTAQFAAAKTGRAFSPASPPARARQPSVQLSEAYPLDVRILHLAGGRVLEGAQKPPRARRSTAEGRG